MLRTLCRMVQTCQLHAHTKTDTYMSMHVHSFHQQKGFLSCTRSFRIQIKGLIHPKVFRAVILAMPAALQRLAEETRLLGFLLLTQGPD